MTSAGEVQLPSGTDVGHRSRLTDKVLGLAVIGISALAWLLLAWFSAKGLTHHSLGSATEPNASAAVGQSGIGAASPTTPEQPSPVPGDSAHHHVATADSEPGTGAPTLADGGIRSVVLGISAWALMILAMMLPPALPMLEVLRRLTARQHHRHLVIALGIGSFVAVWTVVGAVLVVNNAALQVLAGQWAWLADHGYIIAGGVLVAAGIYQFTPLKNSCLRACRTPRSFAFTYWRGCRPVPVEMMTLTGAYAASCVGCCWALMTVCFAVGVGAALPAMIILSVVMAVERLVSWGPRLIRPVGVTLIVVGALLALGVAPGLPG
jgi:predicted metal-binding membrane protein